MSTSSSSQATVTVQANPVLGGEVVLPGSKSITQRYFNLALLGRLPLVVERPLLSEDTLLFLAGLKACGFRVERKKDRVVLRPEELPSGGEISCGNGGTMFRFLAGALTTVPGHWILDGVDRLRERPVGPLLDCLRQLGADIECTKREGYAPLAISGGSLQGGEATLDASSSSQFLSSVLMATLVASRPSTIRVLGLTSEPYVDLTLDALNDFGGQVERFARDLFHIRPSELSGESARIEADFSAAAYPAAAVALCGESLRLRALRADSRQGDRRFIDLLENMGARVRWVGDELEVGRGELQGVEADLSMMPDQVPTLAALAPFAAGVTRITNVPHLRIKESDRLHAMARELSRVGAEVEELADGLIVHGTWHRKRPPSDPVTVQTWGDHRIAMSMALVGLRRPGLTIADPGVVAKSYPDFWQDLAGWTRDERARG